MGNVSGRQAVIMANSMLGINQGTGLLNLLFEILDGDLAMETLEGSAAPDPTDIGRVRFVMGAVVFGPSMAKLHQAFGGLEDPSAAWTRCAELLEGMSGQDLGDQQVGEIVNGHPELFVAAAIAFEREQDGTESYRLYRNPDLSREQAIGLLQRIDREFHDAENEKRRREN